MSTKTAKKKKSDAAFAALAGVKIPEESVTPLASLTTPTPAKAPAAKAAPATESQFSKPSAFNLYPDNNQKIEDTINYLRSMGCKGVNKSRIVQLALRQLQHNAEAVEAFKSLPDYR